MRYALLLGALLTAAALPAAALLTRPDRDDAEYLEMATRYASAVALGPGAGEGVLIAPRWILTLARNAVVVQRRGAAATLDIGGHARAVASVHMPPEWKPDAADELALILLREPVADVEPTPILRDKVELGKGIVIVGHGSTGPIGSAPRAADGKARGGINTVDEAGARTLATRLKTGDEASDLQGALAPDEAGAPAFLEIRGALYVAGIAEPPGASAASGRGTETFLRVSARADWIDATMFRAAAEEAAAATKRR